VRDYGLGPGGGRAGEFELGDMSVTIREGGDYEGLHAVITGSKTLAGSVVTLIECVIAVVGMCASRFLKLVHAMCSSVPSSSAVA